MTNELSPQNRDPVVKINLRESDPAFNRKTEMPSVIARAARIRARVALGDGMMGALHSDNPEK